MTIKLIEPQWPAPDNVKAFTTSRIGGCSRDAYAGLNLGDHVGDDSTTVAKNRDLLDLPDKANWLNQTHSTIAVNLDEHVVSDITTADATFTSTQYKVCTVMTADCLPVLICDKAGQYVAAVHAGWRGLADGILAKQLALLPVRPENLLAWIGPAISREFFEVGADVYDAFTGFTSDMEKAFDAKADNKYMADLSLLAEQQLKALGVKQVYQSNMCTYKDEEQFYSYRRNGQTGRMASCIWIN